MTAWLKTGCTAVITGPAGGIGLELARRFSEAGMNIVIADTNEAELKAAEASLSDTGAQVLAVTCDVAQLADLEKLQQVTEARFGNVHCLINNAGIARMGAKPWEDIEAFNPDDECQSYGRREWVPCFRPVDDRAWRARGRHQHGFEAGRYSTARQLRL